MLYSVALRLKLRSFLLHMKTSPTTKTQRLGLTAGLTLLATGVATTMPSTAHAATYTLDFDQGANGGEVLYNTDGSLVTTQWSGMGLKNITGTSGRTHGAALFNTYNSTNNAEHESDPRSGGLKDNDLRSGSTWGTEEQGNLLIIQEQDNGYYKGDGTYVKGNNDFYNSNGYYRADDEAKGGTVKFEFDHSVLFNSFSLMDVDDDGHSAAISIKGTGADGGFDIDVKSLIQGHEAAYGNAKGTSFKQDGVTITQMGTKRGNNSLYQFDLDANYFANMRVENIEFKYPGSGAIAGIEWSIEDNDTPQEIPESSVIGGLLMVGFLAKKLKRNSNLSEVSELA